MFDRQAGEDIRNRAERTDGDLAAFEIGEACDFRIDDDNVIRPLDQDTRDFDRQAAQITGHHRLQYQIVIDVAAGQRGDRNVRGYLHQLGVEPFLFEEASVLRHPAAEKRHIGIGNSDGNFLRLRRSQKQN